MVKNPLANEGDLGSSPGSGRSPRGGNGNPLQHSCLENSMDRRVWWAAVPGATKSQTRLSDYTHTHTVGIKSALWMTFLALRILSMTRGYTQAQMSPATVVPGLVFPVFITRLLAVITRVHPIYLFGTVPEGVL